MAMKTALVTGASRGIGRGVAYDLARQGYGLTISSRSERDLTEVADELHREGSPRVVCRAVDLANCVRLPALVQGHEDAFGSMDALILSGGIGTAGPFESLSHHRIDKTMAVNITSSIATIQHSLPLLRLAGVSSECGARVILLASISGVYAEAGLAVYGASKAALVSLAAALNAEESGAGIMFTAVAPAFVDTDMSAWAADKVPPTTMIPVDDIVRVVRMVLGLDRRTSITEIVLSRSGANPYSA